MKKILSIIITLVLIMAMCVPVFADSGGTNPIAEVTDIIGGLTALSGIILGALGALVFAVQVVVQLTKEAPRIRQIPTKLYVIIVSMIICELALFIIASLASIVVLWYYIVLAAFMAFVVAYIAIYGWDTLKELYLRYSKLKE